MSQLIYAPLSIVFFVLQLFLAPTLYAQNAATAAGYIDIPKYAAGDWWMLRNQKGVSWKLSVKEVAADGTVTVLNETRGKELIYTKEFNKVRGFLPRGGQDVYYSPHNHNFSFPLHTGKEWNGSGVWHVNGGQNNAFSVKGVVEEQELFSLKLPNGEEKKFPALRIRYEHTENGTLNKSVCWYVPEIQYLAKCDSDNSSFAYEVIDYHRQK